MPNIMPATLCVLVIVFVSCTGDLGLALYSAARCRTTRLHPGARKVGVYRNYYVAWSGLEADVALYLWQTTA